MCGNSFYQQFRPVETCLCNNPCPGNPTEMCGGQTNFLNFFNLSMNFIYLK